MPGRGPGVAARKASTRVVRRLGIIVVTYQSSRHIDALLDSLPAACPGMEYATVVVDNHSTDGTAEAVERRTDARVVRSGGNVGYAAGINAGMREIGRNVDAVAILNPDLTLREDCLRRLAQALHDPGVGVAAPRLVDDHEHVQPSIFLAPTAGRAWGDAVLGRRMPRRPHWSREAVYDQAVYDVAADVFCASGAAWLVAMDAARAVGDWDERFFLFSEEIDYARRLSETGFRFVYVPSAVAQHVGSGSGTSPDLAALMAVNRVRAFRDGHGRAAVAAYHAASVTRAALRAWQPGSRRALAHLVGLRPYSTLPHGDLAGWTRPDRMRAPHPN